MSLVGSYSELAGRVRCSVLRHLLGSLPQGRAAKAVSFLAASGGRAPAGLPRPPAAGIPPTHAHSVATGAHPLLSPRTAQEASCGGPLMADAGAEDASGRRASPSTAFGASYAPHGACALQNRLPIITMQCSISVPERCPREFSECRPLFAQVVPKSVELAQTWPNLGGIWL